MQRYGGDSGLMHYHGFKHKTSSKDSEHFTNKDNSEAIAINKNDEWTHTSSKNGKTKHKSGKGITELDNHLS